MNLALLLSRAAQAYPLKIAVAQGKAHITYRELERDAGRIARGLHDLGITRGDRVAIIQHNSPSFFMSLFGIFKIGAIAVPLNVRLHPKDFSYILHHCEAKVVLHDNAFQKTARDLSKQLPLCRWQCVETPITENSDAAVTSIWPPATPASTVETDETEVAWLFYTSGTTGRPKGAMLTHRNLLAMTMNVYADHYPVNETDVVIHAAPLSHGSGLYSLASLAKGATNILHGSQHFSPKLLLEEVEAWKVSLVTFLAPTQVKRLADLPEEESHDTSSLRAIIWGGGPMFLEDARCAIKRFGPILTELYGQGEAPMTITALNTKLLAEEVEQGVSILSAGLPRLDVEVRIVNEYDEPQDTGKSGEVVVRGGVVMLGYWKNPEATERTLRGGWLHTGDIGYFDSRGYLYLNDRKNDLIISGGTNIYPREVEEALMEHPEIREAVVFGVPDAEWGESVRAAIVPLDPDMPLSQETIISFCRTRIAAYKRPRSVVFLNEVPKNAYGKVLRREVKRLHS